MARRATSSTSTPDRPPIFVKVARTGSSVQEVCLNGDRTVKGALDAYGVDIEKEDHIRVNGVPKSLEDGLKMGDIVTVAGRIQGGC